MNSNSNKFKLTAICCFNQSAKLATDAARNSALVGLEWSTTTTTRSELRISIGNIMQMPLIIIRLIIVVVVGVPTLSDSPDFTYSSAYSCVCVCVCVANGRVLPLPLLELVSSERAQQIKDCRQNKQDWFIGRISAFIRCARFWIEFSSQVAVAST